MPKTLFCLVLAVFIALAGVAQAQDSTKTLAGYGVGYGEGQTFTYGFAGVKVVNVFGGKLFTVYQHGEINGSDAGGDGVAAIYTQPFKVYPDLHLLFNIGAIDNIAADADGELVFGATVGGGIAWAATEYMGIHIWLKVWDTGPELSTIGYAGLHIKDPAKLVAPVFKFIGDKVL